MELYPELNEELASLARAYGTTKTGIAEILSRVPVLKYLIRYTKQ